MGLQDKLIKETVSKDAFGEMIRQSGTTPNEWRYEGEQYDQGSGLYDLRARWMDPGVGRFTSRDTFSGTQTDPISLHPYLYTEDDPVNRTDPSGRDSLSQYHGEFLLLLAHVYDSIGQDISQLLNMLTPTGKLLAELLIHENEIKYWNDINLTKAMNAIIACIYNREKFYKKFDANGSTVSDIIHADQNHEEQFAGFGGYTNPSVISLFKDEIYYAKHDFFKNGENYYVFVGDALEVAIGGQYGVYQDPLLPAGGTYGEHAHDGYYLGGDFIWIKELAGNDFYTLDYKFLMGLKNNVHFPKGRK